VEPIWHEKIEIGKDLLRESIDEKTALICFSLASIFLKLDGEITRKQLVNQLGAGGFLCPTKISHVLGLMKKKGLISFSWRLRKWESRMFVEGNILFFRKPFELPPEVHKLFMDCF